VVLAFFKKVKEQEAEVDGVETLWVHACAQPGPKSILLVSSTSTGGHVVSMEVNDTTKHSWL
jgi:hypothetical protein